MYNRLQKHKGFVVFQSPVLFLSDYFLSSVAKVNAPISMINAGINDGDLVIVRQQETAEIGQIVVALIGNEATLKRYRRRTNSYRYDVSK